MSLVRPTPRHRASNPQAPVYMVLQPASRTAARVTPGTGELLPHLFTLAPAADGTPERLFSVPVLCPHGHLPVRKCGALCCPDFPLPAMTTDSDRTVCSAGKITKIMQKISGSVECGVPGVWSY